ncbi:MAG: hypothetical protein ABIO78_01980, partial [Thermoanaerobaculia bacterium]
MHSRLVAVTLLVILVVSGARAERLAVAGSTGVDIIDTANGKTVASVPILGGATQLLITGDGSRLVAISRGPGATSWLGNFKPKGKASVAVIDAESMKVLGQSELGWDASDAQITADGKTVLILSPGAGVKPGSAHAIDLATGNVAGKVDFVQGAEGALLTGADQAVVYFEAANAQAATLLRFFDMPSLKMSSEVKIDAKTRPPAAFENHDLIYLLEASGFKAATLYAVSKSQRKVVASHEVGQMASIGAFDPATSRLFVLNQSMERGKRRYNGRIDVFRNGEPEHSTKTVDAPKSMTFTPDRQRAFVFGFGYMSVLRLDTLEQPDKPLHSLGAPHSTYFTPDQKRGLFYFASEEACCGAGVFDAESGEMVKRFGLGSRGVRIAQALLAATATASSFAGARADAKRSGASSFHYSVYTPAVASVGSGPLVVHPAGKFAYAVDSNSNRLTTIDLDAGDRLKTDVTIKGGARELVALRNGDVL